MFAHFLCFFVCFFLSILFFSFSFLSMSTTHEMLTKPPSTLSMAVAIPDMLVLFSSPLKITMTVNYCVFVCVIVFSI